MRTRTSVEPILTRHRAERIETTHVQRRSRVERRDGKPEQLREKLQESVRQRRTRLFFLVGALDPLPQTEPPVGRVLRLAKAVGLEMPKFRKVGPVELRLILGTDHFPIDSFEHLESGQDKGAVGVLVRLGDGSFHDLREVVLTQM